MSAKFKRGPAAAAGCARYCQAGCTARGAAADGGAAAGAGAAGAVAAIAAARRLMRLELRVAMILS